MKYIIKFEYTPEGGQEYIRSFNIKKVEEEESSSLIELDSASEFNGILDYFSNINEIKYGESFYIIQSSQSEVSKEYITHTIFLRSVEEQEEIDTEKEKTKESARSEMMYKFLKSARNSTYLGEE